MRGSTALAFWAIALSVACVWASGCGGDGDTPAPPSEQAFERPSKLWPDVDPPPEASGSAKGSLSEPATTGDTPATTGDTPATTGDTPATTGDTPAAPATTPPEAGGGAAPAGAGLDALPAEVKQAAEALAAKTPALTSVAFDIAMEEAPGPAAGGPPMPVTATAKNGRVEAMPPDKVRLEGTGDMGGQAAKILMVMNGAQTWIQASDASSGQPLQVIKLDLSAMGEGQTSGGPMPFVSPKCDAVLGQLAEEANFASVTDADLDGEACQMFEGKGAGVTTRVWASKADGMIRRVQDVDASGNTVSDTRVSNIEVNPSLDAARFAYTPPEGVQVMDMGELMKQMLQGMGEAMKQGMGEALQGATP